MDNAIETTPPPTPCQRVDVTTAGAPCSSSTNRRSPRRPPGSVRFSWSLPTPGHRHWHRHKSSGVDLSLICSHMDVPLPARMVLLLGVDNQARPNLRIKSLLAAASAPAQRARSSRLRVRVELPVRSGDTKHFRGAHRDAETRWDLEHVPAVAPEGAMPGMPGRASAGQPPHQIFTADVDVAARTSLRTSLGHRHARHHRTYVQQRWAEPARAVNLGTVGGCATEHPCRVAPLGGQQVLMRSLTELQPAARYRLTPGADPGHGGFDVR